MSGPVDLHPLRSRRLPPSRWLLGADPVLRQRTARLLGLLWLSLLGVTLLALGWAAGLVPAWSVLTVSGVVVFNPLALYCVVRSGWWAHWSDSSVAFAQVMSSTRAGSPRHNQRRGGFRAATAFSLPA